MHRNSLRTEPQGAEALCVVDDPGPKGLGPVWWGLTNHLFTTPSDNVSASRSRHREL
jgi:hypothetical protein